MSDDLKKQRLATLEAPYKRSVWLDDVEFESGMRLLRITIREGKRITQLDVDADTATQWGEVMLAWSQTAHLPGRLEGD